MRPVPDGTALVETGTADIIERIRMIDGQLVILDVDLAAFYGVTPAELRAMVRRNQATFAVEFAFSVSLGGNRRPNLAFTEHGVIVAGSMLGDPGIEAVAIHLVRAFVKLREANASDAGFARRIELLDQAVTSLDARIRSHFVDIYEAMGMSVRTAAPTSRPDRKLH